jgi:hypothetical protein
MEQAEVLALVAVPKDSALALVAEVAQPFAL